MHFESFGGTGSFACIYWPWAMGICCYDIFEDRAVKFKAQIYFRGNILCYG